MSESCAAARVFICRSCNPCDLRTFNRFLFLPFPFYLIVVGSGKFVEQKYAPFKPLQARQAAASSHYDYLSGKHIGLDLRSFLTCNSLRSSCSAVCRPSIPLIVLEKLTTSRRSRSLLWHCWKCRLAKDLRPSWQFTRRHHRFDIQPCTVALKSIKCLSRLTRFRVPSVDAS